MRFWCSVSDRCRGKIGEGKVPPACSSCVYTLCLEQRGLVISAMIDAAAGEWFEHIYMNHQWENQRKQAVLCCHYLSCTLHSRALAKQACCNTAEISLHFWEWFITSSGPSGHYSQRIPHYHASSPSSSASGKITLLKTSQWDISPTCLCHPCIILNC